MTILKKRFSQIFHNDGLFAVLLLTGFFPAYGLATEKRAPEEYKQHHGMTVFRQRDIKTTQKSSTIHNDLKSKTQQSKKTIDHDAMNHQIQHNPSMAEQNTDESPKNALVNDSKHAAHKSRATQDAPAPARDPHAYSDGYDFGPLGKPRMGDEEYHGSVIVDRLESVTSRGNTLMTYDWQAWYGNSYEKVLIRAEGELETGTFKKARNELLWAHAITPYWDTQIGIRYDSGQGTDRGWLVFGVQGLTPYWFYTEATAYVNEQGRTSFRLELEYDWLLTQKLILQARAEMNFYSQSDPSRGVRDGLSDVETGLRLRYEIIREFAPYVGVEWVTGHAPSSHPIKPSSIDALQFVAGVHVWF
jgi:copper resistance protein B